MTKLKNYAILCVITTSRCVRSMEKKNYTIAQVCKITGLPRSTIRFWSENNYISVKQDPNNRYHMFSDDNIWQMFDMLRMRENGVSMDYLNKEHDVDSWQSFFQESLEDIISQKEKLEQSIDELNYILSYFDEIKRLKEVPFVKETPPFYKIIERDYSNPELIKLFRSTNRSVATYATINDDLTYTPYKTAAVPKDFKCKNPLWELNEQDTFYAALIIRKPKERIDTTHDVLKSMVDKGLKPQYMIVHSLIGDQKNDTVYFRAYIKAD